ncbi:hypothetical protein AGLY_016527 [Aphis glycines]|uniref:RNA-directed DNA polymerase n=1 Tax=Aphis glycines TaxID=307491 RepID=A0A6G0SXH9_APHGL|nr:hypothetical protein AGLY_016527 [Aphis glycines]
MHLIETRDIEIYNYRHCIACLMHLEVCGGVEVIGESDSVSSTGLWSEESMCSYYRKDVKDFAKIAHPLSELIKSGTNKITWLGQHNESFNKLKKCLISEPLLMHFDDNKHAYLTIDASIMGLGACIENKNKLHPVGYASRKLLDSGKTYSSTTLELLGLSFGIQYFREYLWGRKENKVADSLSRSAINNIKIINKIDDNIDTLTNLHDIKTQQKNYQFCNNIIKALNNEEVIHITNEILYYRKYTPPKNYNPILVIPKTLINDILKSYHDSPTGGHTGISRTIHKIQNKYYWPSLHKDTTNFIKSCDEC